MSKGRETALSGRDGHTGKGMRRVEHVPLYKGGIDRTLLRYRCPGCNQFHVVNLGDPSEGRAERGGWGWTWNGDPIKPTLYPSVIVNGRMTGRCHAFIRDGQAVFLSDSTHDLAGQTVDLPPVQKGIDNTDAIYELIGHVTERKDEP